MARPEPGRCAYQRCIIRAVVVDDDLPAIRAPVNRDVNACRLAVSSSIIDALGDDAHELARRRIVGIPCIVRVNPDVDEACPGRLEFAELREQ